MTTRSTSKRELAIANREQRILAQELHDTVCQSLAGATLLVATVLNGRLRGKAVGIDELERIKNSLSEAVEQLKVIQQSQNLSLKPENLPEALRTLVLSRGAGMCVLECDSDIQIQNAVIAQAIYRVARETLQNVARNEPQAKIKMHLSQAGMEFTFSIAFQPISSHETSAYEGDGLLRKFSEAAGLKWTVSEENLGCMILTVSGATQADSAAPFTPQIKAILQ